MKVLHRPDLFCWSAFDEARNLDFHSYVVLTEEGTVLIDPLPMSEHDRAHLRELGGADWIVVTNSDHSRAAASLAQALGVPIAGPAGERAGFRLDCARWLADGDSLAGLHVLAMVGSKTPGELALLVDGHTLVCGDLVRAHRGGGLDHLPDGKLADPATARASVERLLSFPSIEAVLVGDGWPVFRDGHARLRELVDAW